MKLITKKYGDLFTINTAEIHLFNIKLASHSVPDIVPGAEDFTVNQTDKGPALGHTRSDCNCSRDADNKEIITYTAISTPSVPVELLNLVSWC